VSRPISLTPEIQKRICAGVSRGEPFALACEAAGISRRTGYLWKKLGKEEDAPEVLRQFFQSCARARAKGERKLVKEIRAAAPEDWRAAAWLLQKLNPSRYTDRQRAEHTGKNGKDLPVAAGIVILPAIKKE
jgi:hypothetical protein